MTDEITLTYEDRPWPDGPWMDEPDRVLWKDGATGLDCLVKRHPSMGQLCGYVGVPQSHPAYGRGYSDWADDLDAVAEAVNAIEVHGGLTYAEPCDGDQVTGICHIPDPGDSDEVWWFGFDCAHLGDAVPGSLRYSIPNRETYKPVDYVKAECRSLAEQLAVMSA